jgi:hypothetical protein
MALRRTESRSPDNFPSFCSGPIAQTEDKKYSLVSNLSSTIRIGDDIEYVVFINEVFAASLLSKIN